MAGVRFGIGYPKPVLAGCDSIAARGFSRLAEGALPRCILWGDWVFCAAGDVVARKLSSVFPFLTAKRLEVPGKKE
ncbi:MAG: hypothetical protein ACK5PZ_10930, partial [Pirellula sp.]